MTIMDKAFQGISMPQFYKWGSILFSIGILGSIINLSKLWAFLNIGGQISMISSILFQFLLLDLFLTLYFQIKKQSKIIENPKLDSFLKELQKKDKPVEESKDILKNNQSKTTNQKDINKNNDSNSIFTTNYIKKAILHNNNKVKGGLKKDGKKNNIKN